MKNTDINELIAEYGLDVNMDGERLAVITRRYIKTMEDCQVRCLLHILVSRLEAQKPGSSGSQQGTSATTGS